MGSTVLLTVLAAPALFAQTFSHDIAPIVYRYCAPCHRPGESGPFPLLTYEDVKKRARLIREVTSKRYMPPWPPQAGYGDFANNPSLSEAQIRLIADWVRAGAPQGDPAQTPPEPQFTDGWQLGAPDLIVEAQQAHQVPASGPDVFWNFIFSPEIKTRRYVRAVEIRPGERRLVHHANLYIDRVRSVRREEKSAGAGFAGMDPPIERALSEPDDGHFLFWKPGSSAQVEPDGLSWRLDPGNDLVLNVHLQPIGKAEEVRPSIGLYFTDTPPKKFPMLVQLEHDGAINIPPGDRNFEIADDFRVPMDLDVLSVYPHAHYLGHVLEGFATLPGGERKWLIRIPEWDPNRQGVYEYREPIFLPKGSVISMRYRYDNSGENPRNPHSPPRRVKSGNQATDEMGHLWLQVLPRGGGDRRKELEEALLYHRLEKYPNDFTAHLYLGAILLSKLNTSGAVTMLERAVQIEPKNPEARNELGSALVAVGRNTEAIGEFEIAITIRPDYADARLNLAQALARARKYVDAMKEYREVLSVYPDDPVAKEGLERLEHR